MTSSPTSIAPHSDRVIDLTHVEKVYSSGLRGKVHALRGIRMQVNRGEIFGLLGPNGAGKSTLVKVLMTVIRPTRAEGTMLGKPVGDQESLRRVGYLPEQHKFPEYLTGAQVLDFYGALAKTPRRDRKQRAGPLLELVGMSAWADKKVTQYSKGMRQRLGIANALIHDPDLILLDEPTDGVDPVGRRDIRNTIHELKARGKTVFINSHLLTELEMVSDRVAILVRGQVATQGTIAELTEGRRGYEIDLAPTDPALAANGADSEALAQSLSHFRAALPQVVETHSQNGTVATLSPSAPPELPSARRVGWEGRLSSGETVRINHHTLNIGTDDPNRIQSILDSLRARGAIIAAIRPIRPSLEDLFMQAVTDPITGAAYKPGASDSA